MRDDRGFEHEDGLTVFKKEQSEDDDDINDEDYQDDDREDYLGPRLPNIAKIVQRDINRHLRSESSPYRQSSIPRGRDPNHNIMMVKIVLS